MDRRQLPEDALGGFGVTPGLNEDVERDAAMIHDTPEIGWIPWIRMKTSSRQPLIPRPSLGAAKAIGKDLADLSPPPTVQTGLPR
jgi:hypothetical protein